MYNKITMSLREKIQGDFKEAFKSKDALKTSVLKMLQSEIRNAEIEKRSKTGVDGVLGDDEILNVISREAKKRKDAIKLYEQESRTELSDQEKSELAILMAYLPEQMSEDEVRKIIEETIKETGVSSAQEIGKLMSVLMPKVKGKADGGMVNKIVKELLS